MTYWFYFIFFLLSFGQLQRVSFWGRSVNIYLFEAALSVLVLWGIFKTRQSLAKAINKLPFKGLAVFFIYLMVSFSIGWSGYGWFANLVGLLYLFRLALYFGWFFILYILVSKKFIPSNAIFKSIQIFSVLTIIFSLGQYFLYPDLRNLAYLGWDPHSYRAFGLFFDTTVAGAIYSLLFFMNLFYWQKNPNKKVKKFFLVEALLFFGLILLTYSRIVYLSLIISGLYYLGNKFSWKLKGALVIIFFLLIALLPHFAGESTNLLRTTTIKARLVDYQEGINQWQKNPLIGVGYNRVRQVRNLVDSESHAGASYPSSYLLIMVSSGIFGLVLFIYFIHQLFKKYDHKGKTLLLFLLIASFFDNILLQNFVLLIWLTVSVNLFHKSRSDPES